MAPLLNGESLSKSFGTKTLFKDVSLHLFDGDRVGLIGPNGCGKSTLLKILCGIEPADTGTVATKKHLKIGYVPQMSTYLEETPEKVLLATLAKESALDEYERQTLVGIALGKTGFEKLDIPVATLSGGWKKRLDIANVIVTNPDVLLLDEPTNHLDLEGILWLEKFLRRLNTPYIVTSHDRNFLETAASRMIEINPCYARGYFAVDGSYSTFLEKREEFLQGQRQYQNSLASKVRREIEWLRQTPKARTTKSRSRIQSANTLIDELSTVKMRNKTSKSQIDFSSTGRQSKKLLAAKNISKTLQGKLLFSNLELMLNPGMRVAIVGRNGTGKTTLLKVLAGEMESDTGTVKLADDLRVVYFDQHRENLPEDISVKEALVNSGETVNFQGRVIHVSEWGRRFLFTADRLELPVKQLSGGEKARILIARLMTQPADIIFLDEPTNDLDITTLEILEENLKTFPGAVVFITHDRYMLNDLATLFVGLGQKGGEYLFADYYQWEEYLTAQKIEPSASEEKPFIKESTKKGLSYKEKMELQNMEKKILQLEGELEDTQKLLEDPALSSDGDKLQEVCLRVKNCQEAIENLYSRWQDLEDRSKRYSP